MAMKMHYFRDFSARNITSGPCHIYFAIRQLRCSPRYERSISRHALRDGYYDFLPDDDLRDGRFSTQYTPPPRHGGIYNNSTMRADDDAEMRAAPQAGRRFSPRLRYSALIYDYFRQRSRDARQRSRFATKPAAVFCRRRMASFLPTAGAIPLGFDLMRAAHTLIAMPLRSNDLHCPRRRRRWR